MALDNNFVAADVPDQTDRCFLLTGGNAGVGFQVARVLAARNARVIFACRNQDKARAAMSRISGEIPRADLSFIPLDQADIESVRRAAELALKEPRIDVLVNNAGVMTSGHETTKQGFEIHFGVNHLGCFALSSLLLPKLAETPAARVVVTSSGLHRRATASWPVAGPASGIRGFSNYGTSKLANLLFITELTRRLKLAGDPVTAVSSHPGFAPTALGSGSFFQRIGMPIAGMLFNSVEMSAWGTLHAATGEVRPGGFYGPKAMGGLRGPSWPCRPSPQAQDPSLARELWDLSIKLTGIDPGLPAE
jgi:NAD(P)-dependent dehydrogenase (short-subunit alcohol dehydrogenase family)